jgi:hypothetical protein
VNSFAVIDGDLLVDSRGRLVVTGGKVKVTNAVNYALSNSSYIQDLFKKIQVGSNEDAVRSAILRTLEDMIQQHRDATWLTPQERLASIARLRVTDLSKTSFSFTIEVTTYAKEKFNIVLERA